MMIGGPPFAGKTTLFRELMKTGTGYYESDLVRSYCMIKVGSDPKNKDLWRGWDKAHPLHDEWKKSNDMLQIVEKAIKQAQDMLMITHSRDADFILMITPGVDLKTAIMENWEHVQAGHYKRWDQDREAVKTDFVSRIAASHAWMRDFVSLIIDKDKKPTLLSRVEAFDKFKGLNGTYLFDDKITWAEVLIHDVLKQSDQALGQVIPLEAIAANAGLSIDELKELAARVVPKLEKIIREPQSLPLTEKRVEKTEDQINAESAKLATQTNPFKVKLPEGIIPAVTMLQKIKEEAFEVIQASGDEIYSEFLDTAFLLEVGMMHADDEFKNKIQQASEMHAEKQHKRGRTHLPKIRSALELKGVTLNAVVKTSNEKGVENMGDIVDKSKEPAAAVITTAAGANTTAEAKTEFAEGQSTDDFRRAKNLVAEPAWQEWLLKEAPTFIAKNRTMLTHDSWKSIIVGTESKDAGALGNGAVLGKVETVKPDYSKEKEKPEFKTTPINKLPWR